MNDSTSGGKAAGATFPPLRKIRLAHGDLSYREMGSGRPLILLHGMNGDSRSWAYQFGPLSDRFRLISWDAPGYGESDPCEPTIETFVKLLFELLDRLEARDAVVVGHSMGGIVGARAAAESSKARDGRLARLVLSCTHWGYADPPGSPLGESYARRIREMSRLPREEYGKIRSRAMVPPGSKAEVLDFLSAISMDARPEGMECAGRMIQEADNRPHYKSIAMPVLVLYAENDPVAKRETTMAMIGMLSKPEIAMIKGVGHAPYAEAPEDFNEVVGSFAS